MANPLEISMFALPFIVGAFLSWSEFCQLGTKIVLILSLIIALTSALIFTIIGGLEFSNAPLLSLGLMFSLPILVVIFSVMGVRYAKSKVGT